MADPIIMWFRQDLRLADNPALAAAVASGRPIVPVYVLDDAAADGWKMGGASRWWLYGSLQALHASLERRGSRLILARGRTADTLLAIAARCGATTIHCMRAYEPWNVKLADSLAQKAAAAGVVVRRFAGALLAEPETIATHAGDPFQVFSPFFRSLRVAYQPLRASDQPQRLAARSAWPQSDTLDNWGLLPTKPDWAGGLRATWTPGEAGALERLDTFVSTNIATYADERDRPDLVGTSRLSPHLHFGEISPHRCWRAAEAAARDPARAAGAESFLREIAWREFSYHILHHWPSIPEAPMRSQFARFPWEPDAGERVGRFEAWARGETGYPIVDAGMRELWQTGWMHNRVRMITASFLTKHLLVPWQAGARWFWDTLVDADLANNSTSWQWVAGCGPDAAPYFRIFNPVLQGRKFDPEGTYVRRYVPELTALPPSLIHAPWMASAEGLANAGVRLGQSYPRPIVEHDLARRRALGAFAAIQPASHAPPAA